MAVIPGRPYGNLYTGPDGTLYQLTYSDEGADGSTTITAISADGTTVKSTQVTGTPGEPGGLRIDDSGTIYLFTATPTATKYSIVTFADPT
ncbi:hypothetical protein [Gordonia crocea]|uniref:Uncharacterized protein n=1 Tax=Gordonia crocea TaxID=589162 RepID=A0A7I9V2I6_9ACTN|nr:hypothetical protein [Gordonia crocea]GED99426.1 hypothetical protein nbrc107697_34650 [Gordonia crocea]